MVLESALVIDEKLPIIWLADIGLPAVKLYGKVIEVACAEHIKKKHIAIAGYVPFSLLY